MHATKSHLVYRCRAGLSRISFKKTFQRRVLDTVVASELDWILTSHLDMVINKDKIESAMSDHDMITWGLNLKKHTMPSNVIKGLRNYTRINKSNLLRTCQLNHGRHSPKGQQRKWLTSSTNSSWK
jgi:hypothetical protein